MALRAGTEDRKKVYLAAGLGIVMLVFLGRFLWQTFGPGPAPVTPSTTASAPHVAAPTAVQTPDETEEGAEDTSGPEEQPYAHQAIKVASSSPFDPTLHPELMREAESLEYTGNGRNIFSLFSAPPPIPKAIASARQTPVDAGPPKPPPPPPISLLFYGYAAEKDGHKQVFLLQGDDIFIASEGDVVDRRYRVGKIGAATVQIEDLPYHNTQTLPLRQ